MSRHRSVPQKIVHHLLNITAGITYRPLVRRSSSLGNQACRRSFAPICLGPVGLTTFCNQCRSICCYQVGKAVTAFSISASEIIDLGAHHFPNKQVSQIHHLGREFCWGQANKPSMPPWAFSRPSKRIQQPGKCAPVLFLILNEFRNGFSVGFQSDAPRTTRFPRENIP